ncbi:unnamed protein product [Amoebophrya sp. A25]|nr:unnamed protein product [Amoebophrya sp. A25]|eukprot:GSA25T00019218001.1
MKGASAMNRASMRLAGPPASLLLEMADSRSISQPSWSLEKQKIVVFWVFCCI